MNLKQPKNQLLQLVLRLVLQVLVEVFQLVFLVDLRDKKWRVVVMEQAWPLPLVKFMMYL